MQILIVRLSALGDCVHAVPFVEAVKEQWPEAEIGWLIQGGGLALLGDHPAVSRFHVFDRKAKGMAGVRSLLRLRAELREHDYDLVVDLQGLTKSGVLARLAGANRVVGFAAPESRELNRCFIKERVRVDSAVEHVVDRNLALLPALELEIPARASWQLPTIDLAGTEIGQQLDELGLDDDSRLAVINPGTTWPTKIWPQEQFATLARRLVESGLTVMVSWGDPGEEVLADRIVALASEQAAPVAKAAATSLQELRGLYQRASLVIANDSGPLHLAVAVGTPTVGVYGPTDPARNGPYGWRDPSWCSAAVTLADLDQEAAERARGTGRQEPFGGGVLLACQYCWKTGCAHHDQACMTHLDANAVADRALSLLRPS